MLVAHRYHTHNIANGKPWLVWLHGLLGNAEDWLPIINQCRDYPSLAVDLPGHGNSQAQICQSFQHFDEQLNALLFNHNISEYYLIGYSLGARLAMHFACMNQAIGLKGLVIEAGNVGLLDENERAARADNDSHWANRFRDQPIDFVLNDWYQQAVFNDLTALQREKLIMLRRSNNPQTVAKMLESTSLSKQPFLADKLHQLRFPYRYFCGERDHKFRSVSQQFALPFTLIENAGHNAHRENPQGYAAALHHFLSLCG